MKIAFSTISCPAYTAEQMAQAALEYGYDAVELYALEGERLTVQTLEQRWEEVRDVFRAAGVPICSLNSWGQFSMADPEARAIDVRPVRGDGHDVRPHVARHDDGPRDDDGAWHDDRA